ncbi:carboxypeptidase regulatory-like domain-containing protein [Methanohalobium sp.]|uniref:carboxypeptidase regulatory-like domain-containing protein n=1 Tax=Methanohalobium sp. TaxID=2837493 RepID=UPI0025D90D15|nr:carboxypeptidase regulatory-like domain-containing protein [Methanohalobium sp.]
MKHKNIIQIGLVVLCVIGITSGIALAAPGDTIFSKSHSLTYDGASAIDGNNSQIYVKSGDTTLEAYDSNGNSLWTQSFSEDIFTIDVDASNGYVLVGLHSGGGTFAYNQTGSLIWSDTGSHSGNIVVEAHEDAPYYYSGGELGDIIFRYKSNGSQVTTTNTNYDVHHIDYNPVSGDVIVLRDGASNGIDALDATTGSSQWSLNPPTTGHGLGVDDATGNIYVGGEGEIHEYDTGGNILNNRTVNGWVEDMAIDAENQIAYAALNDDGSIEVYDLEDGSTYYNYGLSNVQKVDIDPPLDIAVASSSSTTDTFETKEKAGKVWLNGTVTHSLSGVEGVSVEVYYNDTSPNDNDDPVYTTTTDAQGNYSVEIEADTYNVYYFKEGYEPYYIEDVNITSDTTKDVPLTTIGDTSLEYIYALNNTTIEQRDMDSGRIVNHYTLTYADNIDYTTLEVVPDGNIYVAYTENKTDSPPETYIKEIAGNLTTEVGTYEYSTVFDLHDSSTLLQYAEKIQDMEYQAGYLYVTGYPFEGEGGHIMKVDTDNMGSYVWAKRNALTKDGVETSPMQVIVPDPASNTDQYLYIREDTESISSSGQYSWVYRASVDDGTPTHFLENDTEIFGGFTNETGNAVYLGGNKGGNPYFVKYNATGSSQWTIGTTNLGFSVLTGADYGNRWVIGQLDGKISGGLADGTFNYETNVISNNVRYVDVSENGLGYVVDSTGNHRRFYIENGSIESDNAGFGSSEPTTYLINSPNVTISSTKDSHTLNGTVVNQTYDAIENATVEVYDLNDDPHSDTPDYRTFTDSLGNYELTVQEGKYNIYFKKPNHVPVYKEDITIESNTTVNAVLHIANYTVYGFVTDSISGKRVPNATIHAYLEEDTEGGIPYIEGYFTQTDIAGYYEFSIPANDYDYIRAYKEDYEATYKNDTIISSDTQINFTITPQTNVNLTGYVYDNDTGEALSYAQIKVGNYQTYTNESGYYQIGLVNGTYETTVSKTGYDSKFFSNLVVDGNTQKDFYLDKQEGSTGEKVGNKTLYGYVTDTNLSAIEGATVIIDNQLTVTTNASGYYAVNLDNGTYELKAFKEGYESNSTTAIVEGDTQVDFILNESPGNDTDNVHTVIGEVLTESQTGDDPVTGAEVGIGPYTDITDADGTYSIEVLEGTYNTYAKKDGYITKWKNDTSITNDRTIDFYLLPGEAQYTINGYITDTLGKDVTNAVIIFNGTYYEKTTTNKSGYYTLEIIEGNYDITIKAKDYNTRYDNNSLIIADETKNYTLAPVRWIVLDAPSHMKPKSNATYDVLYYMPAHDIKGKSVLDTAVVTSNNTTIVEPIDGTLFSGDVNASTTLYAEYSGLTDNTTVYVANVGMENIQHLPAPMWIIAFVGSFQDGLGQPFHWIFVATVLGTVFTLLISIWAGLSIIFIIFTFALLVSSISLAFYLAMIIFIWYLIMVQMDFNRREAN